MSTIVDETQTRIADRLRFERESRGWSLAEVALRSGVSRAMINKIERCEASPTATLLVRLAAAFDLTLGSLIARAEGAAQPVVRAAEQPVWRDPASGYVRCQLFERPDHPIELVRVELPPGVRVGMPASSYVHIRQILWLLEGELVIEQAGAPYRLRGGDCFGWGPPTDTTFVNESDTPCTYVVVVTRQRGS